MNILPQKSWHVRTKKNIERVRRDEEKAAEEEKERQRKIALAEQEARTELLRQRARQRQVDGSNVKAVEGDLGAEVATIEPLRHINFFSEVEEGKKSSGKNADNEAEKKAEQEKLEMKIGLLTYLGQGSAESQTEKPWYLKRNRDDADSEDLSKNWKLKKKLDSMDPMNQMVEYVSKKKSSHKEKQKHKKHKHSHKLKEGQGSSGTSQPTKTIAELRAERLQREAAERQKSENLLKRLRGEDTEEKADDSEAINSGRKYNSQYNPELVRQPRTKPAGNQERYSDLGFGFRSEYRSEDTGSRKSAHRSDSRSDRRSDGSRNRSRSDTKSDRSEYRSDRHTSSKHHRRDNY